jgi:hypothetical protein
MGTVPLRAHTRKLDRLHTRGILVLIEGKAKIPGGTLVLVQSLVSWKERFIAAKKNSII